MINHMGKVVRKMFDCACRLPKFLNVFCFSHWGRSWWVAPLLWKVGMG